MDKVFFFFTKINNFDVYGKELKAKGFFTEAKEEIVNGETETEFVGFNRSEKSKIAQLYFSDNSVKYNYILDFSNVLMNDHPLVFLICDNEYRKSDNLLNSLFKSLSKHRIYCYFHVSNESIKNSVFDAFNSSINGFDSFRHEKGEPFFELIHLINVNSHEAFKKKTEEIQQRYLGTDGELKKKIDLGKKLILLHKILAQNFKLKGDNKKEIKDFLTNDFTYIESLKGLKKLRNQLLNYSK